jgi:hypothetical protein
MHSKTKRRRPSLWPTQRCESGLSKPRARASAAQREKIAGSGCAVCGRRPVDPAHLVPQRFGGCPHPDCVVGLCRTHHRLFDRARLSLGPYLDGGQFEIELAHALGHVEAEELERALGGGGWPPPWIEEQDQEKE